MHEKEQTDTVSARLRILLIFSTLPQPEYLYTLFFNFFKKGKVLPSSLFVLLGPAEILFKSNLSQGKKPAGPSSVRKVHRQRVRTKISQRIGYTGGHANT